MGKPLVINFITEPLSSFTVNVPTYLPRKLIMTRAATVMLLIPVITATTFLLFFFFTNSELYIEIDD